MRVGVIMGGMLFGRSEQLRQLPDVARAAEASGVDMLTLPAFSPAGCDGLGSSGFKATSPLPL